MKYGVGSLHELKQLKTVLEEQRALARRRAQEEAEARHRQQTASQLFAQTVGPVTPVPSHHQQRIDLRPAPALPRPLQRERDQQSVLLESLSDEIDISSILETDDKLSYRQPGVGPDVTSKLRKGYWSVQRQLDLHGLRRDGARETLGAFIRECQRQGVRCVRIITGKGLGSPGKTSIIKHKTYGWLMQKKEVLAFVQARPNDGGAGALIVLLAPGTHPLL